jgi:thiamine phosphate synthase YjbQ (UPF0047 family)
MIELNTRKEVEVIDITSSIEQAVKESGIEEGIALIYTPSGQRGRVWIDSGYC